MKRTPSGQACRIQWNGRHFLDKYMPAADKSDAGVAVGYSVARTLVHVLDMRGDNLTRGNVMKQATNLNNFNSGLLLPGIKIDTSASDLQFNSCN